VLPAVVPQELAGLDRLPPVPVVAVPRDGLRQPVREVSLRRPPEPAQLRRVDRVAAVVTRTIGDVADERLVGPGQLEDPRGQLPVLDLLAAADVVDLAGPT